MNNQVANSATVNISKVLPNDDTNSSTVQNSPKKKQVEMTVAEDWKPVRSKKNKSRAKNYDKSNSERLNFTKDELTFLMDEDLSDDQQLSCAGRRKTYTDYDDYDNEISDQDIGKIIIVMQTSRKTEQVYDRTGDFTTRVKVTQEMAKIINDGLYYYEQDLWSRNNQKQHKTLGLISQEDFDLYSGTTKTTSDNFSNTPPPPPPPSYIDETNIKLDDVRSGMLVCFGLFNLIVLFH